MIKAEQIQHGVEVISGVTGKSSVTAGAFTALGGIAGWLEANYIAIGAGCAIVSAAVHVVAALVNMYFKHRQDRRHQRALETQIDLEEKL